MTYTDPIALHDKYEKLAAQIEEIVGICRRHANPSSNSGAHALAVRILRITGDRPTPVDNGGCGRRYWDDDLFEVG